MESKQRIKKKIVVFLFLTFALSSISYVAMITTGTARKVGLFWMWSPGVAAIITKVLYRERLQDFGWQLGESKYLGLGLAVPFLYAVVIYSVIWITGLGTYSSQPILKIGVFATVGLVLACFAALGEEIGWRGLLIPELITITSFSKATLVTGIIWAIWHYPAIMFADYKRPTPILFQLIVFTVAVIGYSIFAAWLRIKSGSMWPAVIWHGGHNLFIQQIFLSMTEENEITYYFADDFGIGVLVASIMLGIIIWSKRSEIL